MRNCYIILVLLTLFGCAGTLEKIRPTRELEEGPPLCAILTTGEERYLLLGEDLRDGALIGLDNIRSKVYNTAGDPIQAIEQAKLAIFTDSATCIIGPLLSSTAIPVACISELSGVPMISPTATEQRLPLVGEFIFKLYSSVDAEELAMARFIMNNFRFYKIVVLAPDDSYGRDIAQRFNDEIERLGGGVFNSFFYPPGSSNLREYMISLREIDADAVFIPAYESDITGIASQFAYYEAIDSSTVVFGLSEWGHPALIEEYKNYLPYVFFTSLSDFDGYQEFETDFTHKYARTPTRTAFMGYSAAKIISVAMSEGAIRRDALKSWLSDNQRYQPVKGISLNKEEVIPYVRIYELYRGELEELKM